MASVTEVRSIKFSEQLSLGVENVPEEIWAPLKVLLNSPGDSELVLNGRLMKELNKEQCKSLRQILEIAQRARIVGSVSASMPSDKIPFLPYTADMLNGVMLDFNSFFRNLISARIASNPAAASAFLGTAASVLGLIASLGMVGCGLSMMEGAYDAGKGSCKNGDIEGVIDSLLKALVGGSFAGVGVSFFVMSSAKLGFDALKPAAPGMAAATNYLIPILYGALAVKSIYNLAMIESFRSKFEGCNDSMKKYEFLASQISLTKREMRDLARKFSGEQLVGAVENALSKKIDQLIRRVGPDCVKHLGDAMTKKDLNKADIERVVALADEGSYKARANQILLLVISILGIAAFVASLVTTGGLSGLLYALAAVMWFSVDSHWLNNKFTTAAWTFHNWTPFTPPKIACMSS